MALFLTGSDLENWILEPPPPSEALVESFLYAKSVTMLTGKAGKGKSILGVQIAAALSSGVPLFSILPVPKPRRVYYLQLEGQDSETRRRLHFMKQVVPVNGANFLYRFDKTFHLGLDKEAMKEKIDSLCQQIGSAGIDLFIPDPVYKLAGDVAKAENAERLTRFCDDFQESFPCTILLIHHPHRERYDYKGNPIQESNPYYGHSFIYNHVDSSFKMENPSANEVRLFRDKRREENTMVELKLHYHPETYTLSMLEAEAPATKSELVEQFLTTCFKANRPTFFNEILEKTKVSGQFLRELQTGYLKEGRVTFHKSPGKATLWISNK